MSGASSLRGASLLALGLLAACGDGLPDAPDAASPFDAGITPDLGEDAGSLDLGPSDTGALPPHPDASTPPAPTIFDVQQGFIAPGAPVVLEGVVTGVFEGGVFLSEAPPRPFGGIFVAVPAAPAEVGDVVRVSGVVEELRFEEPGGSRTQVRLTQAEDLRVVGTASAAPGALELTLPELALPELAEPYEGTLVALGPRTLTSLSTGTPELELDRLLRADGRALRLDSSWFYVGARFERVVGLVHYDARGFFLLPRGPEDAPRAAPTAGGCLPLRTGHLLCLERDDFADARIRCAERGGRLVILETAAENATVSAQVADLTDTNYFAAATDQEMEGEFLWVDGSTLAYDPWARGEPNDAGNGQDCVQINFRNVVGQWDDIGCGARRAFVCEFERDPPRCATNADCGDGRRCVGGGCGP